MSFAGQKVIDFILLLAAVTFTVISTGYVLMLWSIRRDFFIVLRSPRLACAMGFLTTLHFMLRMVQQTVRWSEEPTRENMILGLTTFPVLFTAEMALIMTAVRLLIMYYPSKRVRWGRYTKERPLAFGLVCGYATIQIAVWSAAASQGVLRVANVLVTLRPPSVLATVFAAVCIGGRLRRVHDLSNMSHDVRCVGSFLLGMTCFHTAMKFVKLPVLALKYFDIAFLSASHPPIIWICVIRPVRRVLRHIPERRRSTAELLLVSPHVIVPPMRKSSTCTIAITADAGENPVLPGARQGDANRLASIMSFLPLREAFGDFCRRSLCSESFQFLLDVSEFKEAILLDAAVHGEDGKGFKGFGNYSTIVNDYIEDGSHSEVNIEFKTKCHIRKFAQFQEYASLDQDECMGIFSAAEQEVGKVLADNLLNAFLRSAQYKAVVDFDELTEE